VSNGYCNETELSFADELASPYFTMTLIPIVDPN